ncbi:MAG TPA: hypothetical protein VF789_33380 [Thermoanaerobaculia bacterium]
MSKCLSLALVLTTIVPSLLNARETPRNTNPLTGREPGEVRLHLTAGQLESLGVAGAGEDLAVVGLRLREIGSGVEGDFRSALGRTSFRSLPQPDGRVSVQLDLPDGRGTLALAVDPVGQTAEASYSDGAVLTPADRFVFRALAIALESELASDAPEADLLLRAARLWGDHPLQPVRLRRIEAPREKSWTNLCGVTSARLAHDGSGHGLITETLATGPNASNCRSRCGAGCDALVGTSAWTVDCGEHDRCEQHHSCCTSCQDEFNSASDDYLFAPNCRLSGW